MIYIRSFNVILLYLKRVIIDSRAKDENKNTLTTNSIHTENIINEETLNNQDIGAGYHEGEGTKRNEDKLTPMIPISIDKNKKSITYAGIQKGKLIIKGNQNYNVDKVNRNTQDTLNTLENTLDLKDIEEKKRLSELFAKYANGYIHDISKEKGWKEGSEEKVILHTIIGGITAKLGGNTYQAGAMAGAVNEAMNGAIREYEEKIGKRIDAATHQWLSVAVVAIVNQAAGMSMQTGAAEAVYGTKWNYLTALPPENILKKFVKEETISDQSISEKEIQQILKTLYSAWNDMYNPSNKDIQFDLNSVQEGVFIDSLKAQGINDKASREILKRCKQYAIRQFIHSFNVYRLPEVFVNARRQSFNVAHVLSANSADAIYMIWIPAGTKISSETKKTGKYRVGHAVIVQGGKAIGFGPYNGNIGKSQNGGVHVEDARYIMDLVSQGKATIRDVKYGYEAEKTGKRINSFIYKHHVHIKEGDITLITLDRSSGYQKYGGKAWLFSNNCINFANDLFEPSHPMPTYLEFGYGPGKYIDYSDEYSHKPD